MRTISQKELKEILEKHKKWVKGEDGGEKADLREVDLQGFDLRYVDLRCADLQCADLRCADLRSTDLRGTDLRDTNVYGADLKGAYRPWLVYAGNIGSRRSETIYFADYNVVKCGCWNNSKGGTLTEFKARIDEVYPADSKNIEHQKYRLEYLSAIKMFESMREAYLKKCNGGGKSSERNIDWGIE